MIDRLAFEIHTLAFAVVTGGRRLTPQQAGALADLNAAAALVERGESPVAHLTAVRYTPEYPKEIAR